MTDASDATGAPVTDDAPTSLMNIRLASPMTALPTGRSSPAATTALVLTSRRLSETL